MFVFRMTGILALAWFCSFSIAIADGPPPKHPNIILIMADDLGYECIAANGGQSYQTPHLDRLAAGGMRFEHCHVQPLCTPTRVQLMTGLYNIRNYIRFGTLARTERTFGHLFQEAGYVTGVCGKWQLGREPDSPQHFGFDESYLWQHTRRPPRYANPGLEHDAREVDFTGGEYGPKLINDFALDFITRHQDEQFFLYYPMILTHSPFQPTPDSPNWNPSAKGEKVNNHVRYFADMTNYMDQLIGRLDHKLDELGIRDNTLLIFLGDNGTGRGVVSRFHDQDYAGGKGTTTRRGTHVPLIVSWPAVIRQGKVNSDLISSVDFLPTICQAAGIPTPPTDGVSFYPQLIGEKGQPRLWLYHWYSPRQGNNLTITEYAFNHDFKMYRDGRFYHLEHDPEETQPVNIEQLTGDAIDAARLFQSVFDQFRNARRKELG